MILRVDARADADLNEAIVWYAERGRGTACGRLWIEWVDGLTAIRDNPRICPLAEDGPADREVRNYLTRRYGYRLIYEIVPTEIVVHAFIRASRRPGSWLSRLTP